MIGLLLAVLYLQCCTVTIPELTGSSCGHMYVLCTSKLLLVWSWALSLTHSIWYAGESCISSLSLPGWTGSCHELADHMLFFCRECLCLSLIHGRLEEAFYYSLTCCRSEAIVGHAVVVSTYYIVYSSNGWMHCIHTPYILRTYPWHGWWRFDFSREKEKPVPPHNLPVRCHKELKLKLLLLDLLRTMYSYYHYHDTTSEPWMAFPGIDRYAVL